MPNVTYFHADNNQHEVKKFNLKSYCNRHVDFFMLCAHGVTVKIILQTYIACNHIKISHVL